MTRSLVAAAFALAAASSLAYADEQRPLRLEAVDQVIEQNDHAVQSCGRKLRGDTLAVMLRLEIAPNGRVTAAESVNKPTAEAQCLMRVARHLVFPASATVSHVEYPFMLLPQLRR